jgi:hypothetical protein
MSRLDAEYYLDEARKCEAAAAKAQDRATKEYWLESARCWLTLANQAHIKTAFSRNPKERQ